MMTADQKTDCLKEGIFGDLPEGILKQIASRMGERNFADGDTVFLQGEPGDEIFVVVDGDVEIHIGDYVVAVLPQGQVFGEMAVLGRGRRTAGGRARGEVRLLFLKEKALKVLLQQIPDLAFGLFQVLIQRLDEANRLCRFLSGDREVLGWVEVTSREEDVDRVPIFHELAPLGCATGAVAGDALRIAIPVKPDQPATLLERHAMVRLSEGELFISPLEGDVRVSGEPIDDFVHIAPDDAVECGGLSLRLTVKDGRT